MNQATAEELISQYEANQQTSEEELTEDTTNDTETTKSEKQEDVFYSDSRGRDSEVLRSGYDIHGKV